MKKISEALKVLLSSPAKPNASVWGIPTHLVGPPGVGKSTVVEGLTRRCVTLIGSGLEPTDVGGFPIAVGDRVKFASPSWVDELVTDDEVSILFLDELTTMSPATLNAFLRLVLERAVNGAVLPPYTRIVAASNPPEWGGGELTPAMKNRFAHLYVEPDPDEVGDFLKGCAIGVAGDDLVDLHRVVKREFASAYEYVAEVAALFVRGFGRELFATPEQATENSSFFTPRSFTTAVCAVATGKIIGASADTMLLVVGSLIGNGAAAQFLNFVREQSIPLPQEYYKDWARGLTELPPLTERDRQTAFVNALIEYADRTPDEQTIKSLLEILAKGLETEGWRYAAAMGISKLSDMSEQVKATVRASEELTRLARELREAQIEADLI